LNLRPPGYEPDELPDCSIPRYFFLWCRGPESNRYGLLGPQDFKSCASASSATPAFTIPVFFWLLFVFLALRVGFEPTTYRLTAGCSTVELPKNILPGNFLLSQVVSNQVPSALRGLTSVFGMVTGVSLLLSSPSENYFAI
jgi:hypothetical protein